MMKHSRVLRPRAAELARNDWHGGGAVGRLRKWGPGRRPGLRGAVLPIVLVCAVLLVGMVVAFQFITASDYKQAARLTQEAQARALADLAFDEVWHNVYDIQTAPGSPRPQWLDELVDKLESARRGAGTGPVVNATHSKSLDIKANLPITSAAQKLATEIADLKSVTLKMGPFTVDGGNFGGAPKVHYQEELFQDAGKDLRPWDLKGPLRLEVEVSGSRSPIQFAQTYTRGQTLMFTDTTPVGRDFCTFVYGTPPSADYAINDLNANAGLLNLYPQHDKGRLMFRGPMLVAPEEAPTALGANFLGGDNPQGTAGAAPPMSYPDLKYAPELAMVPGPRELQHPDAETGTITGVVSTVLPSTLQSAVQGGVEPRRPSREESKTKFQTKTNPPYRFSITLTVCGQAITIVGRTPELNVEIDRLSMVLARGAGTGEAAVYQSLDLDKAAYYPPMGFAYCLRNPGQQKLVIHDTNASINNFNGSYQGLHIPNDAARAPQKFTPGLGRTAGTDPNARFEGDVVVAEPVLRTDGKNQNVGLMGLYGVAHFESKTYLSIPIIDLNRFLIDIAIEKNDPRARARTLADNPDLPGKIIAACGLFGALALALDPMKIVRDNKETLAQQALANLRIDPNTQFMIRRYRAEGAPAVNFPTSDGQLRDLLTTQHGLIVPYGAYSHESNFWNSAAVATGQTRGRVTRTLTQKDNGITMGDPEIMRNLLREPAFNRPPNIAAVDPGWPVGGAPSTMSDGLQAALTNLSTTIAGRMNRFNDAENKPPGQVVGELFGKERTQAWALPPNVAEKQRPRGVFLPPPAPPVNPDLEQLATQYPRGFFPPKYRDFLSMATRQYETFDDYALAESIDGAGGKVLPLKGAVLIKKLKFTGPITYRGRGIIMTYSATAQDAPSLTGVVRAEAPGAGHHLTLVHRVNPEIIKQADAPMLELGQNFDGTIVADTGVKPAAGTAGALTIKGNLVVGLLNHARQGAADVNVSYDPELSSKPAADTGMKQLWTPELNGQATSVNPGS